MRLRFTSCAWFSTTSPGSKRQVLRYAAFAMELSGDLSGSRRDFSPYCDAGATTQRRTGRDIWLTKVKPDLRDDTPAELDPIRFVFGVTSISLWKVRHVFEAPREVYSLLKRLVERGSFPA